MNMYTLDIFVLLFNYPSLEKYFNTGLNHKTKLILLGWVTKQNGPDLEKILLLGRARKIRPVQTFDDCTSLLYKINISLEYSIKHIINS